MRTIIAFLIPAFLTIVGTYARNDWNEPCITGFCKYDLDSSTSGSSGTLQIWGPDTVISDITAVAGWRILECNEHHTTQEIRLVCADPSASCSHLFSHTGPKNKIVRLPEKCGINAFARVAEARVSTDQYLPPILVEWFQARDIELPQVYALRLDTNFHEIDHQTMGSVRFAIEGVTIPGVEHNIDTHSPVEKWSNRLVERNHEDIIDSSIQYVEDKIKERIHYLNIQPPNIHLPKFEEDVKNDVKNDLEKMKKPFCINETIPFGPIYVKRNITLFKETINCPPLFPGVEIALNPVVRAHGTIGIAASGTVVPPHIADFNIITNLSADINATLTVLANVAAVFDTGKVNIFKANIPGLDFPGIFSLKPKLLVDVQSKMTIDLVVGARIGINYYVQNALTHFSYKKGVRSSVHQFGSRNSPLKLKATPYVQAYSQSEAKVIPQIGLGISMFNKEADLSIRAECTSYLRLKLEADTKDYAIKKRGLNEIGSDHLNHKSTDDLILSTRTRDDSGHARTPPSKTTTIFVKRRASPSVRWKRGKIPTGPQPTAGSRDRPHGMDTSKGPAFRGCLWLDLQLDMNVGSNSHFITELLDKNTKLSFFKATKTQWEKCLGVNDYHHPLDHLRNLSTSISHLQQDSSLVKRSSLFGLKCLSRSISTAQYFVDETANIQFSSTHPLKS